MKHSQVDENSVIARKILFPIAFILAFTTMSGAYYAGNFTHQTKEEADFMYIIATIVTVSGIAMSYFAVRKILKPLYISNKHLEKEVDIKTEDLKGSYQKLNEFSVAMQNISNSIIMTGSDGSIEYVNEAFEKNTGYLEKEVIGKNSKLLQAKNPNAPIYNEITKVIYKGKVWTGELLDKRKDGTCFWQKTTVSPVFVKGKKFHKFITVKVDITKEINLRENLRKSYNKLKELDKKKDEFISIVSHELRTPMSIIKGYISLLRDGALGEVKTKQEEVLKKIFNNTNNLICLVNDMLDLGKLESGKIEMHCEDIYIHKFMLEIHQEFEEMYNAKGLLFTIVNHYERDVLVKSDREKLKRVLTNLLGNASKFTPEKGEISIHIEEYPRAKKYIQVRVKDSGIGIPKKNLKTIFNKFQQVANHFQREMEGTGLGLAIVKDIISKLGGRIFVKSVEGQGAEFIFTLPKK